MSLITYDNKSFLNQNANIPAVNKVCDTDLNEIKTVVNANYNQEQSDIAGFYYSSNDKVQIGGTTGDLLAIFPGIVTTSTKDIIMTITTPKRLDNISSILIESINCRFRGISGYLNSDGTRREYASLSGYTCTGAVNGLNSITIRISKSTAFTNTTNNTPVMVEGYISVKLL